MSAPSGYNLIRTPKYSDTQMQRQEERLGQIGTSSGRAADLLGKYASGDEGAYNALSAPALRQFREQILPDISSRYSYGGSSMRNAGLAAGTDLAERLSAQRANLQMGSIKSLLDLEGQLLSNSPYAFEYQPQEKKRSIWESIRGPAVGAIGGGLTGFATGGPWGAAAGSLLGGLGGMDKVPDLSFLKQQGGKPDNSENLRNLLSALESRRG